MSNLLTKQQLEEIRKGRANTLRALDFQLLLAHIEAQAEVIEWYEQAILWALGENGDFRLRPKGAGAYWWRTELRKKAALSSTPTTTKKDEKE